MRMVGDELPVTNHAQALTFEINLTARSRMVIQIEQQITNWPALEGNNQFSEIWPIARVDCNNFGNFKMACRNEIPGPFFTRKG